MVNCCNHSKNDKKCIRSSDKKSFKLPRKFSRRKCRKAKGFTMRASCAPYKDCKRSSKRSRKQKGGKTMLKTAYFAGGCFWGIQELFDKTNGISDTKVGYMGGKMKKPTYTQVCNENTGHAETVKIIYDPQTISYKDLLKLFNEIRTKNITDTKSQYRSIIFTVNKNQKTEAKKFIKNNPDVELLSKQKYPFYLAEDYHQKYKQKPCNHTNTEDIDIFNRICKNNSQDAEDKYKGKYLDFKENGIYLCGCCGQKLYRSKDKYDSDTGWPAFSKSFSEKNILYNSHNNELRCSGCGLHLGHRSFDGPTETKIHDCINSVCLFFQPLQKGGKSNQNKTIRKLPTLRKIDDSHKKHKYHLSDPQNKRILAINEGINYEMKNRGLTKKKAAISKKGRFNILRIYRKNNKKDECRKLTSDMRYIDKKYNLGKTNNICKGGGKQSSKRTNKRSRKRSSKRTKNEFLYNPDDPKKSFDVYKDKNPKDTIPIKYTTLSDVKNTIKKLETLYKNNKYNHKRIWQVGMILYVRLKVLKNKKPKEFKLSERYFKHLGKRSKIKHKDKDIQLKLRKRYTFKI